MADIDVLVLRRAIHGIPIEEYAEAVRERLPDAEVVLARTPGQERELVSEAEVVTGLEPPEGIFENADELELFACMFGIAVTNASGVHESNASEWVLGQLLVFARGLHVGWRRQERHEYRHFRAGELAGSTVTVVGMGAIGTAILERLSPFGVETIGVRYSPEKGGPADEVVGMDEEAFHGALARSDYLVLACPLTEETRHLVDEAAFETLSPEAVLVNVARGEVVDTAALLSAVRTNGIRGAALDVTDPEPLPHDHPLWTFDNVLITPHTAGQTPAYYERNADILAENVRRLREDPDATLRNQVT